MVKFGTYSLPHVLKIQTVHGRQLQEIILPGRPFAYRRDRAGLGARIALDGAIRATLLQLTKDQIAALADGTARILDPEADLIALEECLRSQTWPTWTDNTAEAASAGGTPFTLLGATTDYAYFGHREKWNKLQFTLQTLGVYGLPLWEYSQGAGAWGTLDLLTLIDDFLGSALDTTIWTLHGGVVTVASSIITLGDATHNGDIEGVATTGPFGYFKARMKPHQTNGLSLFAPYYVDDNNKLSCELASDGNIYLISKVGGVQTYSGCGAYDTNWHDFTLLWLSNKVQLFRDGIQIGSTITTNIPQVGSPIRLFTGSANLICEVDYVKYCPASVDGTTLFSQSGTVTLTPPSDWKQDTVDAIANKFWLRVSVPSVTTPATVNQILMNKVFNCIMLNPVFHEDATNYGEIPYTAEFVQVENP